MKCPRSNERIAPTRRKNGEIGNQNVWKLQRKEYWVKKPIKKAQKRGEPEKEGGELNA